jgi:hypothetical protein
MSFKRLSADTGSVSRRAGAHHGMTRGSSGRIQPQATRVVSGVSYTIQAADNQAASINWSNPATAVANGSGRFSFADTNAPHFPKRLYRALFPEIQLRLDLPFH